MGRRSNSQSRCVLIGVCTRAWAVFPINVAIVSREMPSLMARTIGGGSILLALILAPAPAASAQTPPVVTRVVDADTITVSGVGSVDEKTGP